MTRERQKITWKDPYTLGDAIRNTREYGLIPALSHDWKRTKSRLEKTVGEMLFILSAPIAVSMIPIFIYKLYKIDRVFNKGKKQLENTDF